jgi:hypothetical protein
MFKKKGDWLAFMKSDQFHCHGFKEVREGVENSIQEQFWSNLVDDLKSSNYVIEKDGVKVYLAKVRYIVCSSSLGMSGYSILLISFWICSLNNIHPPYICTFAFFLIMIIINPFRILDFVGASNEVSL